MSKLQLRSKRRPVSPSNQNGHPKADVPLIKKPKKSDNDDFSESESSSDEFVRPSADLKISSGCISRKNGPSPVPDFSSIESSIFSGVSRLSESDSDDSDFEEISNTPAPDRVTERVSTVHSNVEASLPENKAEGENVSEKVRGISGRQTRLGKGDRLKSEAKSNEIDKSASEDRPINKGRTTRASKRKPPEEDEIKAKLPKASQEKAKSNDKSKSKTQKSEASTNGAKQNQKASECKKVDKAKDSMSQRQQKPGPPARIPKSKAEKAGSSKVKEEKKDGLVAIKNEIPESLDNMDIAQLLALGEGLKTDEISPEHSDSASDDWEEVDAADVKRHEIPKEGVQITLAAPEFSWRRKKQRDQQACLQAEMNRAFNRVRRELQLLCHKTSLLLWIGHGIFLNRVINVDSVKAMALSLVPADLSVRPKVPGRKYIDQLLKWFSKDFECSEGFPETLSDIKSRPLASLLEQHFSRRYAKSAKELTFMFVTMLRAVGIESRLIISFQPMPLKPQSDELLAINSKSKRGRQPKKEVKIDDESDDADDPPTQSDSPKKKRSKSPEKKTISKPTKSGSVKADSMKTVKHARKSEPLPSKEAPKKGNKSGGISKRKSEPSSVRSPVKTRGLRQRNSKNSYKEEIDSDVVSSDEEETKPILSPQKKKDNTDTSDRLKAAAAKRLPTNRRFALKSNAKSVSANVSKKEMAHSDSDDDFEPKSSPQIKKAKELSSSQKSSSSQRSQSQKSDSDSDFETKPKPKPGSKVSKLSPKKGRRTKSIQSKRKGIGKKVLSSDDDSGKKQLTSSGSDYWVEVYLHDEERWTCVDVSSRKIDSTKEIMAKATQPICYVIAFNPDGTLKDVTKRYSPKFSQVTSKQRVSAGWWDKTLKPFRPRTNKQEIAEDSEMNMVELDRPMPKSVGECKNHPLYVLKRHLLKFEAIYPPDSPSLGFVRNEAIYARQNVYTLHSREIWMKDAKVVRLGEEPYKIVKARPKYDRLSGKVITDLPLEVFGPWQVEDYVPPPAVDGKVPRNAYGNVELFKPSMLPKGCVHLQVPGLTRVAKKLRIDCAPAVVGFDYHSGGSHPTYDGFVVCEEYVDVLMDAWNKEIDESAKRREEKHEKRVYGNWRRLIKGLLIREALKYRYDFKGEGPEEPSCSQSSVNIDALRAARIAPENSPLPSLFPKLMANIRAQKSRQRCSTVQEGKSKVKPKTGKQAPKSKARKRRNNETSEEEESDWDSSTTEEDDNDMVLLSDEDSGSEFEDLKK